MRMRKKKNGIARIEACSEYLIRNKKQIDVLREEGKLPCRLEIGCGKGDFAVAASERYREEPYIAMELISDVALCALEKAKAAQCGNLKILIANAKNLTDYFQKGDVKVLYLNFSDPWPKKGHTKRRLTYRGFLELYKQILTDDGKICFKTDNAGLFEFSLDELGQDFLINGNYNQKSKEINDFLTYFFKLYDLYKHNNLEREIFEQAISDRLDKLEK